MVTNRSLPALRLCSVRDVVIENLKSSLRRRVRRRQRPRDYQEKPDGFVAQGHVLQPRRHAGAKSIRSDSRARWPLAPFEMPRSSLGHIRRAPHLSRRRHRPKRSACGPPDSSSLQSRAGWLGGGRYGRRLRSRWSRNRPIVDFPVDGFPSKRTIPCSVNARTAFLCADVGT